VLPQLLEAIRAAGLTPVTLRAARQPHPTGQRRRRSRVC
jgi:hypothetical protein